MSFKQLVETWQESTGKNRAAALSALQLAAFERLSKLGKIRIEDPAIDSEDIVSDIVTELGDLLLVQDPETAEDRLVYHYFNRCWGATRNSIRRSKILEQKAEDFVEFEEGEATVEEVFGELVDEPVERFLELVLSGHQVGETANIVALEYDLTPDSVIYRVRKFRDYVRDRFTEDELNLSL